MRFDGLAANTPQAIRARAKKVKAVHQGVTEVEGLGLTDIFVTSSRKEKYLTWVHVNDKGNCTCSCACGYFVYNLEVALAGAKASVVIYSNGAPPVIRNPMRKKFLCKHLYRVWMLRAKYGVAYHPPEEEEE